MEYKVEHRNEHLQLMENLTPQFIVGYLDKHIVGQSKAKKTMAIALRNRYRRMKLAMEVRESIIPKNIMMIGPTGVGKTEIARKLAKLIGAPFVKVEATKYTEVGYVGRDVESMVRDLVANSISIVKKELSATNKGKILKAANAQILSYVLNQKLALHLSDMEDSRISEMVHHGVLDSKEIEIEIVPQKNNPLSDMFQGVNFIGMDLGSNLPPELSKLFGKEKKVKRKVAIEKARELFQQEELEKIANDDQIIEEARWRAEQLGIIFIDEFDKIASSQEGHISGSISREGVQRDILPIVEGSQIQTRYGLIDTENILFIAAGAFYVAKPSDLIPELQGRFPVRVELDELSIEDFEKILSETEYSLVEQYVKLIATEDVKVQIDPSAIHSLAKVSYSMNNEAENIGARRLYTVMEKVFEELMYISPQIHGQTIVVDQNYVEERIAKLTLDKDAYKYIL